MIKKQTIYMNAAVCTHKYSTFFFFFKVVTVKKLPHDEDELIN